MSRAFVKEPDGDSALGDLPERPISRHRNLVTASGLARIDAALAELRARLATATESADGKSAMATLSREVRYWTARRATAELVTAVASDDVRFGATVTIERGDGRRQTFRIVGEDEADPAAGSLSYVAPLAQVLIGKSMGDEVEFMGDTITIVDQS